MKQSASAAPSGGAAELDSESLDADLRYRKVTADLSGQAVRNLLVSRHALDRAGCRVAPQRVTAPLTLEIAPMSPQVPE